MVVGVKVGLRRLALRLEYKGTNYSGFQIQPKLSTIQGAIQEALHGLMGESTLKLIVPGVRMQELTLWDM